MYALDAASGNKSWEFEIVGVVGSPAVVGGTVFFGSGYGWEPDFKVRAADPPGR